VDHDRTDGTVTDTNTITQAARTLAELGASKGGKARAKALTSERRREIAIKAAQARWDKKRPAEAPEGQTSQDR
jgi:hypothetical protein